MAMLMILLLVLATTAVGGRRSDAAAAFFVHQLMLHDHRHCYDSKLQLSGGVISEVFQSAIRSLDKRQQSKERLLERRRQRRREQQFDDDAIHNSNNNNSNNNNSNNGDHAEGAGIHFVSPLLDDGYPPAVHEYEEDKYYSASSTSSSSRRKQQQQQQQQQQPQRRRPKKKKPLLLYLPGFDGTIIAPFIQYPALNEEFHIFAMTIDTCNRSTFDELIYYIVNYLLTECKQQSNNNDDDDDNYSDDIDNNNKSRHRRREVYLMGESFGGLLAIEVALELQRPSYVNYGIELRGLILVNPATSYLRSKLYRIAPTIIAKLNNNNNSNRSFIDDLRYNIALFTRLIPLFVDKGQSLRQLYTILSSHGLPSVINTPAREAYMGRVAFTLFDRISFMPIETLRWRLDEWLEWGASIFEDRLDMLTSVRLSSTTTTTTTTASTTTTTTATNDNNNNHTTAAPSIMTNDRIVIDNYSLLKISQELRTLIIVGEYDNTLPSVEEATRLSNELFRNSVIHVVPNAGHASTCGGSLNLMKVLREVFPELNTDNTDNVDDETRRRRRQQSSSSRIGDENTPTKELYGLVSRYDNAWIGLNPLLYWSKEYYRKCDRRKGRK